MCLVSACSSEEGGGSRGQGNHSTCPSKKRVFNFFLSHEKGKPCIEKPPWMPTCYAVTPHNRSRYNKYHNKCRSCFSSDKAEWGALVRRHTGTTWARDFYLWFVFCNDLALLSREARGVSFGLVFGQALIRKAVSVYETIPIIFRNLRGNK